MKIISRIFASQAIQVRGGHAKVVKGKLAGRLVREVACTCQQLGIADCELWIDQVGRVTFSKEIAEQYHQKFYNIVLIHR